MKLLIPLALILIAAGGWWLYSNRYVSLDNFLPEDPSQPTFADAEAKPKPEPLTISPRGSIHHQNFPTLPAAQTKNAPSPTPQAPTIKLPPNPSPANVAEKTVVHAFASCDDQYRGADYDFRAQAAQLALDEQRQTLTQLKKTVNQYCAGGFTIENEQLDQIVSQKSTTRINPPTPTGYPTATPKAEPDQAGDNLIAWNGRFNQQELEQLIHKKINNYRISRGLKPLKWVNAIHEAARSHSTNMAKHDYLDHLDRNMRTPSDRLAHFGYPCYSGENIFQGYGHYRTWHQGPVLIRYEWLTQEEFATKAVQSWIDSPGHHENMIRNQFTETGIGIEFGESEGIPHAIWVTQKFC